jgi:aspartyl aminopeptidase
VCYTGRGTNVLLLEKLYYKIMMKSAESILEISKKFAYEIIDGLNYSVTAYHAVDYCRNKLLTSGFRELSEK